MKILCNECGTIFEAHDYTDKDVCPSCGANSDSFIPQLIDSYDELEHVSTGYDEN
jgi:rRNA maturation endonuclease Nob1